MSDPGPSTALYRKCPVCYGTRKTRQPATVESGPHRRRIAFMSDCPFCRDGYVPIKATADVAENAVEEMLVLRDDRDALLLVLADASQGTAEEALAACAAAVSGRLGEIDEARTRQTQGSA